MKWLRTLLALTSTAVWGQHPPTPLAHQAAGFENVIQSLVATFDRVDVLALGEEHGRRQLDSKIRIGIIRHPDFARKVHFVIVEFVRTEEQLIIDRYVNGEDVSLGDLQRIWKRTISGSLNSPVYLDLLRTVREVNLALSPENRIRVLACDEEISTVSQLKEQVFKKHDKALVIYGAAHLFKNYGPASFLGPSGGGIIRALEGDYPGRAFVVITLGRQDPNFEKFESAVNTSLRPVLIPLKQSPFNDFKAEAFIGVGLLRNPMVSR